MEQERLVFVVSPPRAGSTLLQRMLGSHSQIFTHPEPHLITPLAYLGYYDTVDQAPYDHINAAEALRLFVEGLPRGEEDYLDALRAFTQTLYGRMLEPSGKRYFLDKTPAYALVLPFLSKLHPRAKYIVLTRHPLAVFSSYANSFFGGDWRAAHHFNPLLERYVPAIARFLRDREVSPLQVAYESLVEESESELKRIFGYLELEHEAGAVEYGERFEVKKGPGDPHNVGRFKRPVTAFRDAWVDEVRADRVKGDMARAMLERLDPSDIESWGYSLEETWQALEGDPAAARSPLRKQKTNWYAVQRKVLLMLREDVHRRPHGRLIRRLRYYCDVILRDQQTSHS